MPKGKKIQIHNISCALYSKLELYALRNRTLEISYRDGEITSLKKLRIKTLRTRKKVEYLITQDDLAIRLDDIVSINPTDE